MYKSSNFCPIPPKHLLESAYVADGLSLADMSLRFGVSRFILAQWMDFYGVVRRKYNEWTPAAIAKCALSLSRSPKVGHKIEMECFGCGKLFTEYASRRPLDVKYCDMACSLRHQRRAGEWQKQQDTAPGKPPKRRKPGETLYLMPPDESGKRRLEQL